MAHKVGSAEEEGQINVPQEVDDCEASAAGIGLSDFIEQKFMSEPGILNDEDHRLFQTTLSAVNTIAERFMIISNFLTNSEEKNILHVMAEHNLINHMSDVTDCISEENVFSLLKMQDVRSQTPLHIAAASKENSTALVKHLASKVSWQNLLYLLNIPNVRGGTLWDMPEKDVLIDISTSIFLNQKELVDEIIARIPLRLDDIEKFFHGAQGKDKRCIIPNNQSNCKQFGLLLCPDVEENEAIFKFKEILTEAEISTALYYTNAESFSTKIEDFFSHMVDHCSFLTVWILAKSDEQTYSKKLVTQLSRVRKFVPVILLVQSCDDRTAAISDMAEAILDLEIECSKLYYARNNGSDDIHHTLLGAMASKLRDTDGDTEFEEMINDVRQQHYSGKPLREYGSYGATLKPISQTGHSTNDADTNEVVETSNGTEETQLENKIDLLSGDWKQEEEVGHGTFGTVFLYSHFRKKRSNIAVKLYRRLNGRKTEDQVKIKEKAFSNTIKTFENVKRELIRLRQTKQNSRSYVVDYLGYEKNPMSVIMEYMAGKSIKDRLKISGKIPPERARLYTTQILEGLTFLHSQRVIHRDVKCSNVLLDETLMIAKLTDFDTAKWLEKLESDGSCSVQTNTGYIGTFRWTAPEVLNSMKEGERKYHYGRRADVWSVGATVHEMVTGHPPLTEMDVAEAAVTLYEYDDSKYDVLVKPGSVTEPVSKFLKRVFVKDKTVRPSAAELKEDNWLLGNDRAEGFSTQKTNTGVQKQPSERIKFDDCFWNKEHKLGGGAFGEVHRYKSEAKQGNYMAVKSIKFIEPKDEDKHRKEFEKEIKMMKDMPGHVNIVAYKGCVDDPTQTLLLCMEFILGENLGDFMTKKQAISEADAKRYSHDILSGLEFLHGQTPHPIIHRDLNCGNVLHDTRKQIMKITDFGLSKYQRLAKPNADSWHKHTGERGTIQFMAPEVFPFYGAMETNHYGQRADIWSFGVLVVMLKTGKFELHDLPWDKHAEIMRSYKDEDFRLLTSLEKLDDDTKLFLEQIFVKRESRKHAYELVKHPWLVVN